MRKDLAQIVCCPVHKTPLDVKVRKRDQAGDILEGSMRCAACDFDYPIEEGIPNLLPPSYHVDEVKEAAPKDKAGRGSGNAKAGSAGKSGSTAKATKAAKVPRARKSGKPGKTA